MAPGRGPAWANSLFEDNAEFGLGMRLAVDNHEAAAREPRGRTGDRDRLVGRRHPRRRPVRRDRHSSPARAASTSCMAGWKHTRVRSRIVSQTLARYLVKRSVWLIGGDGWAYDIGFGGVDHVLASGRDVNILVLDTEVYSNTGGQTSKATPRAAIAKFSAGGKTTAKKDLGMIAMAYGDVYVAHIAMGANMTQTVKAMTEAAAHPGPSLVIAYSPCIAHGIDMSDMMGHQKMAADSGYWPLYRYDPHREADGDHALLLGQPQTHQDVQGVRHDRGEVRHGRQDQPGRCRRTHGARPTRHRRSLAPVRTDGRSGANRTIRNSR